MFTIDNERWTLDDFTPVLNAMSDRSAPLMFVFDVDCTLVGAWRNELFNVRPGAVETLRALHDMRHHIWLWSAAGKQHCLEVAEQLGIEDILQGCHSKPPFPMVLHRKKVLDKFGRFPDVTIDDDESERVSGSHFVKVSTFWGDIEGL